MPVPTSAAPGSPSQLIRFVRSGAASTRSDLARLTGLAPSTISIRVDALLSAGVLAEMEAPQGRDARRRRRLAVRPELGVVAIADVGAAHTTLAIASSAGSILVQDVRPVVTSEGPEACVDQLWSEFQALAASIGRAGSPIIAVAVSLPAPVANHTGRAVQPTFMPDWHQADVPALFGTVTDAPVIVENDANLTALGEHRLCATPRPPHILAVKIDTMIGCGIISSGQLHRGASGAAGELGHTAVNHTSVVPCGCGVPDCLESVAGGAAIAETLRRAGHDVTTTSDILHLGAPALPALREAGTRIGAAISASVNFFNPNAIVFAGTLSTSSVLVAAARAEIYRCCLPLATHDLDVYASSQPLSTITGAIDLSLERAFDADHITLLLERDRRSGKN